MIKLDTFHLTQHVTFRCSLFFELFLHRFKKERGKEGGVGVVSSLLLPAVEGVGEAGFEQRTPGFMSCAPS